MSDDATGNPFQSPSNVADEMGLPQSPVTIQYEAELTRKEVNSAMRNPLAILLTLVMLIPVTLWYLFWIAIILLVLAGIATMQEGDDLSGVWLIVIGGILLNSFLAILFYSRLFPANRILRNRPRLLLRRTGTLTADALYLQDADASGWMQLSGLTKYVRKGRTMILTFDRWGLITHILLTDGFSDPVRADQIFEHHVNSADTDLDKSVYDPRLMQEPGEFRLEGSSTSESIPFDGILNTDDLRLTPFNRARVRLKIKLFFLMGFCLLSFAALMLWFWMSNSLVATVIWLIPPLVVAYFLYMVYSSKVKPFEEKSVDLIRSKGWIDTDSITILTAIDQSRVNWNAFMTGGSNDHAIWLQYPGKLQLYVVLAEHRFADRTAFEYARTIVDRAFKS